MTPTLYKLIWASVALSAIHHLDHLLRGATGWPFIPEVNPFTYSLAIYPVIGVGLLLSRRGVVGPRFWSVLSSGGALFVTLVHVGPVAGDALAGIPNQYGSPVMGYVAIALLVAFLATLVGTFAYETKLARR